MAVASIPLFFVCEWYWGVGALVLGYLLQYVGHLAEGNDLGEWAAIKRLLGLPYVGIAPRWNPEDPSVYDSCQLSVQDTLPTDNCRLTTDN